MHLPEPKSGGSFERTPPGTHLAVCYRFVDLGTQESNYKGEVKTQRKVMLSWEFPEELMTEGEYAGRPFTFHQRYTWSMHEKATLRKDLEAWRGVPFSDNDFGQGGFDIRNILGKSCLITLIEEANGDKIYTNKSSIGKLMKSMVAPTDTVNPIVYFALTDEHFSMTEYKELSDSLQGTIAQSPEFKALTGEVVEPADTDVSAGHAQERIPDDAYANH